MTNPYQTTRSTPEQAGEEARYSMTAYTDETHPTRFTGSVQLMTTRAANPTQGANNWEELRIVETAPGVEAVQYFATTSGNGTNANVQGLTPAALRALASYIKINGTPNIDACEEVMIEQLFNSVRPVAQRSVPARETSRECPAYIS